ncbi:tyrosine-type recombinase/integrase [Gordonia sp. KTR9]|uniref:tyrosine-type recombinase/integrase n=1 Tax=Gordonia sp. KTR9 TaxID=337191 RepID=UPI00027DE02A|nr:tyrosine-type recombinase/integrase [Gordonia sp. KTR9]AFR50125.1 Integrase [Gordonia sp. KTR9]
MAKGACPTGPIVGAGPSAPILFQPAVAISTKPDGRNTDSPNWPGPAPPSGCETRTIAIPTEVAELLAPITDQRGRDELLWSRPDGTPIRPPMTTHWFTKAVERLHAADPSFPASPAHGLRHTAASLIIRSGAHMKTVQRQLGHKAATMTLDLYGHTCSTTTSATSPTAWERHCDTPTKRAVSRMCPTQFLPPTAARKKAPHLR